MPPLEDQRQKSKYEKEQNIRSSQCKI